MKLANRLAVVEMETLYFRVLWWKCVGFGWPSITRNFYGGPSTVFTWGRLWVETGAGQWPHHHAEQDA